MTGLYPEYRIATIVVACALCAASAPGSTNDLTDLPLEDLVLIKVTSVSKRPESLAGAAAAVYRLSNDEVKRDGFRTIADSLRYVPGMQVAQINSHTWAITARGFDAEYATKLLVLMDGRSVYTPLNAGVYWDTVDMMLEDLDRIEVIRGPGGTLWGANAVNGVINITSKMAKDTQGWLVTGGGGNEEKGFTGVRYGAQLGEDTHFRIYGKFDNHDDSVLPDGSSGDDAWRPVRTGFRLDSGSEDANLFTVQGDFFHIKEDWLYDEPIPAPPYSQTVTDSEDVLGANLLGRWSHLFDDDSKFTAQVYVDHSDRESNLPRERRDTFDIDLQQNFAHFHRNSFTIGLGYRFTTDNIDNSYANSFTPDEKSLNLFSSFVQDEISLIDERLRLTLGTKFEHNEFTGFEFQPGVRLAWTPSDTHTVWASIARAVRTPSRAEEDVRINRNAPAPPFPPGSVVSILGNPSGTSEDLVAYELGYRVTPVKQLSLDIATFYNVYDDLRSLEPGAPPATPPVPAATFYVANELAGESYGAEVAAEWEVVESLLRLRGTYTYFHLNLRTADGGTDQATVQLLEGNAPAHQFTLRSEFDVLDNLQVDLGLRYVDQLENPTIPAYTAFDARIAWRPRPNLEISLVGLNLLDPSHPEFAPTQVATPQREVERSVYGQLTWHF